MFSCAKEQTVINRINITNKERKKEAKKERKAITAILFL